MKWIVLFLLVFPFLAEAHRVDIFPYWEGDEVKVEAFFPDGSPVKGGKVKVFDEQGRLVAEGLTDEGGLWSFFPEGRGPFKVVLEASMGHRAEAILEAREGGELPEAMPFTAIDPQALKALVREAVRAELLPLLRELERQRARPTVRDVVGGIGWILGIVGVWMLLKGRKGGG